MERLATMPAEVVVNPTEKHVMVTQHIDRALPLEPEWGSRVQAHKVFAAADKAYSRDPEQYLQEMSDTVFTFSADSGARAEASLIPGGDGSKLLIMWAPFSDCAPRSNAEDMFRYIETDEPGLLDKIKAAPNSWNQLTKSQVTSEFMKAMGTDMSVLTIFSPLPSFPRNVYSHEDYSQIRRGDFSPAGWLAIAAIQAAQDRLHGPRSETRLEEFHLHGASLGASSAIGAANSLSPVLSRIKSVTAQELIVAPKNVTGDLAKRFVLNDPIGEVSDWNPLGESYAPLYEPLIRCEIDAPGNEPAMVLRMLQGMSKLSRLKGLTRPERNLTPKIIERLVAHGVSVAIPLAENSGPSEGTTDWLPDVGEQVVNIRATRGERTSHLVDEHVGLTALLAAMHVAQN